VRHTHRVLLVDDHPGIRHALRDHLECTGSIEVAGEVGRGRDIPSALRRARPDLVILDLELERGFVPEEAVCQIRASAPDARIAIYSAHSELPLVERMTDLKVEGYILKTEKMAIVVHALETILAGERWISPAIALILADRYSPASLTPTERSVLQMLADGQSVKQIAAQMGRSERSIRDYVSRTVGKMKARSREQTVAAAIRRRQIL
jgi:DNA-binding NarL/FixJ family response regulator